MVQGVKEKSWDMKITTCFRGGGFPVEVVVVKNKQNPLVLSLRESNRSSALRWEC